jgi:hypothetical protein
MMARKLIEDYITEKEAQTLTGYSRTRLYQFRVAGAIRWTAALSGHKVRYYKDDLLKLLGL